ncbi:MAG: ATP-binding protein [Acidobacteria bacterium]|nr:ATP-binding protein [Acidobacteriota bacterium]
MNDTESSSFSARRRKNSLFWKMGLAYLLPLLLTLAVLDAYTVRMLKKEYLAAAYDRMESLSAVALEKFPSGEDVSSLEKWVSWTAAGGVRATLIAADGGVLADSDSDPAEMENHGDRPEVREAFLRGSGRAVRSSETLHSELVYLAQRFDGGERRMLTLRLSLPLHRLDESVHAYRQRQWGVSLCLLALTGCAALFFFRALSNRIRRLREFSDRVARGDFRLMPVESSDDELSALSDTLNRTAARLDGTIRALTDEREQSAAILSSMDEGVVVVDSGRNIIFCNQAFRRAAGAIDADYRGRHLIELARHLDIEPLFQNTLYSGEIVRGEVKTGFARQGSYAVTTAPIHSGDSISGAVMVLHDISEIRRLERARRDFVANVSHEFRTPLSVIQGFAETLLDGALEDAENGRRFSKIIYEQSLRLSRLTDDLLKLAQIEAGQFMAELRSADLGPILESCVEAARVLIRSDQKELTLELEYPPSMPPLHADARSIEEILQNLLGNAIRYTPGGGRISVKASASGGEMALSVSDTGIGISSADRPRIFERFYRTDAARSRESGGTGLGLSIVKHLVEFHGGRVEVESEIGRGATFRVFLPLHKENDTL